MKRFSLLFVVLCTSWLSLGAAEIVGKVVDEAGAPLDFVNVVLKLADNNEVIGGGITDVDGEFRLEAVPVGVYRLEISFIGYQSFDKQITVGQEAQTINLRTLKLVEDTQMLNEVEVVGQGSQMRFDIDKKVFSVDQSVAAAGGSATEVLENIPSVEVDNDGNISLRSNSSVEIWINGKPSGLDEDNRAQILEQLPAGSIESIEVITNPSAKFSPEGTAGIINIILKKERRGGFFGSVTGGIDYQIVDQVSGNASANFNYSSSKVDFYINAGFRQRNGASEEFTDRWSLNAGDTVSFMHQDRRSRRRNWGLFGRAGIDWHINDKNTLSVSGMINSLNNNNSSVIDYNSVRYTTPDTAVYTHNTLSDAKRLSYSVQLEYLYEIDKKGSEVRTSVEYSNSGRDQTSDYDQTVTQGWATAYTQQQYSGFDNQRMQFKSDYVQKLRTNMKLEAGIALNWQDRMSNSKTWDFPEPERDSLSAYNDFRYQEWIAAAYATYGANFGGFSFSVGLRGEYTNTTVSTRDAATEQYLVSQKGYFQLYPTAYLSYAFPNDHELQLNYTRRVNRPRGRQLSAYRNVSDSTNISYGNPNLMPEFANALELNYIKSWEAHTLSASLYYRYSTDIVQQVQFESPDHPNVMETTYDNVASAQSAGLEIVGKNRFCKWLNMTTTLNLFYEQMSAIEYQGVHLQDQTQGFSWNIRLMANFLFTKTFTGQLTAGYFSPHVIAQGKTKDFYSIDLGIRKSFLNRTLNLAFTVRDLLNSRGWKRYTWGDTFYQDFEQRPSGQRFTLSLTYNFGNMKEKKKNSAKSGGDSGMGGGDGDDFGD